MRKTATIERYHVYGTSNYCLALFYRGEELTPPAPGAMSGTVLKEYIPDDSQGVARLRAVAKAQGFTHVSITGDWSRRTKPRGGKL